MATITKFGLVWFSLTYQCNNQCKWCYASEKSSLPVESKTFDFLKEDDVINLVSSLGIKRVVLIGGEPTLYSKVDKLIGKIVSKEIKVGMVTNGRRFKDREFTRRLKGAGLEYAVFSVEGSNAEVHENTTNVRGSFDDTLIGLETSISEGIATSTNTVISSLNIGDLEKIVTSLQSFKLQQISFNINAPCISSDSNNVYMVNPKEAVKRFEDAYSYCKKFKIKIRAVTPMPFCYFSKALLPELKQNKSIGFTPCQLVHGKNFVIDYNGDINPCTHLTGFPMFNIFDNNTLINKEEFILRYNSKIPNNFRKIVSKYPSSNCEKCVEKDSCSGGCPLFWTKFNPEKQILSQQHDFKNRENNK